MNAAEDFSIRFHAMPYDSAIAVRADRCQRVDRAFEAIECVMFSGHDHFKRLVVFIFANFACSHTQLFRASTALRRCLLILESRDDPGKCYLLTGGWLWKCQND